MRKPDKIQIPIVAFPYSYNSGKRCSKRIASRNPPLKASANLITALLFVNLSKLTSAPPSRAESTNPKSTKEKLIIFDGPRVLNDLNF